VRFDVNVFLSRTEVETVIHADNDFATVAFLRVKNASLDLKNEYYLQDIYVPSLLEDDLLTIRDVVLRSQESTVPLVDLAEFLPSSESDMPNSSSKQLEAWVAVTNVRRQTKESVHEMTIEDEVKECFQKLQGIVLLWSFPRSTITKAT
jgi:diphthine-ammonia ligase